MIRTVCGDIEADALGFCQPHEHLYTAATPASAANPALCIDCPRATLQELTRYRESGGRSIVDAQPFGAGRDADILYRLSSGSGVSIIASTGYHLAEFYSDGRIFKQPADRLTELYLQELQYGMFVERDGQPIQTAIRAGLVKAAIPADGPAGFYQTCLAAAALGAKRSNRPLMLHTEHGRCAISAIRLCEKVGLSPSRIIVCHTDRAPSNLMAHREILQTGAFIECDTIGRFKYHDDEDEIALLLALLEDGYLPQILLSLDVTAQRMRSYAGNAAIGLDYLSRVFLPALKARGVSRDDIYQMTVGNPARALDNSDKNNEYNGDVL